jgi:uncharacterized protein YdcH (DUF465 family)
MWFDMNYIEYDNYLNIDRLYEDKNTLQYKILELLKNQPMTANELTLSILNNDKVHLISPVLQILKQKKLVENKRLFSVVYWSIPKEMRG